MNFFFSTDIKKVSHVDKRRENDKTTGLRTKLQQLVKMHDSDINPRLVRSIVLMFLSIEQTMQNFSTEKMKKRIRSISPLTVLVWKREREMKNTFKSTRTTFTLSRESFSRSFFFCKKKEEEDEKKWKKKTMRKKKLEYFQNLQEVSEGVMAHQKNTFSSFPCF